MKHAQTDHILIYTGVNSRVCVFRVPNGWDDDNIILKYPVDPAILLLI